jgi:hypothetical protein
MADDAVVLAAAVVADVAAAAAVEQSWDRAFERGWAEATGYSRLPIDVADLLRSHNQSVPAGSSAPQPVGLEAWHLVAAAGIEHDAAWFGGAAMVKIDAKLIVATGAIAAVAAAAAAAVFAGELGQEPWSTTTDVAAMSAWATVVFRLLKN